MWPPPTAARSRLTTGGLHFCLSRVHEPQGQVLVVAPSHLIFLFRHPSQALITAVHVSHFLLKILRAIHTLESLVTIVLVNKNVIYRYISRTLWKGWAEIVLFLSWPYPPMPFGLAKVKFCMPFCPFWTGTPYVSVWPFILANVYELSLGVEPFAPLSVERSSFLEKGRIGRTVVDFL